MNTLKSIYPVTTNTTALVCLFLASLLLTASFSFLSASLEITLIDSVSSPDEARTLIAQMNTEQRTAHAWITGTIDVLYPLVYGLFFAGVALRCFPKVGKVLVLPILLVIPTDLFEGLIQILALTGTVDLLALKAVVTPLKFGLFLFGLTVAGAGGLSWVVSKLRSK
jgi:hypothetical protein